MFVLLVGCTALSSACFFFLYLFFCFNDTATTEISPLSLHDALPIYQLCASGELRYGNVTRFGGGRRDRKSTRLNSSHLVISYAVFCLKKKKTEYSPATLIQTPPDVISLPHIRRANQNRAFCCALPRCCASICLTH